MAILPIWNSHDPTRQRPTQYKSIIFYLDETQRRRAEASFDRETARCAMRLHTELRPFASFHRAEDDHQKYYLRREIDLLRELKKYYPDSRMMMDATAAARINGYLAGFGDRQILVDHGDRLGLTAEGLRRLKAVYTWRY